MSETVHPATDNPSTGADAATHWLLPIDPASHREYLPADWRTRPDATEVWEAIGRTQPIDRWCLRTGYRSMRLGDTIWAYLSTRSDLVAVGTVAAIEDVDPRTVVVDWDADATATLCRNPLPRSEFGQVPMTVCRARPTAAAVLARVRAGL